MPQSPIARRSRSIFPWLPLLALPALLASADARAWAQHYLVTDRALTQAAGADGRWSGWHALDEKVKVEPLEDFLVSARDRLPALFTGFYDWLARRGSRRFNRMTFDPGHPTREAFLEAARLNPDTRFPLVSRPLPGAATTRTLVPFARISPIEGGVASFEYRFEDAQGTEMSARSVLTTFVDEPDWHFDLNLWKLDRYGYGKVPYGQAEGGTSKAAFHILYRHENFIVRTFAPEMQDGMVLERIELFSRLGALAFATGHRYWGYRFSAWAMHYIEDLGQPYHSRAVPYGDFWYYLKFIFSFDKPRIKAVTTQLIKNRHYAYEDFVAFGLQQSYLDPGPLFQELAAFLTRGDALFAAPDAEALVEQVTAFAAAHAPEIDRAVSAAYGPQKTGDPAYDLESDPHYDVRRVIEGFSPDVAGHILTETGKDFEMTGRAARTLLTLILKASEKP